MNNTANSFFLWVAEDALERNPFCTKQIDHVFNGVCYCEKVKAEQTRLFRRLVGGQGNGTMHLLVDD